MGYEVRSYKAGEYIFRAKQFGNFGCIVKSGSVSIRVEKNGSLLQLGSLSKGECFGEMAAITPGDRTADVVAREDTEVIIIERSVVEEILNQTNPVAKVFIQSLVERIARMTLHAIDDKAAKSPMLTVASILALKAKDGAIQSKKGAVSAKGTVKLPYRYTLQVIRDATGLLPYRTDAVLTLLAKHHIIVLKYGANSYISINPKTIIAQAKELEVKLGDDLEKEIRSQFDLIDLSEFANLLEITPEKALEKIAGKHYPEDLFLFRKSIAKEIASSPGEIVSAQSEKKEKKLSEIHSLADLNWVPESVLAEVCKRFRAFELAGIAQECTESIREDFLEALPEQLQANIFSAMNGDKKQDQKQVEENIQSFLEKIRETPPPEEESEESENDADKDKEN